MESEERRIDPVDGGYEATPAEEAVAYVWRDLLGVPRVGRKDDFFAPGS